MEDDFDTFERVHPTPEELDALAEWHESIPDTVDVPLPMETIRVILDLVRFAEDDEPWEPVPYSGDRDLLPRIRDIVMEAEDRATEDSGTTAAWRQLMQLRKHRR